jgi:hypothetical protein
LLGLCFGPVVHQGGSVYWSKIAQLMASRKKKPTQEEPQFPMSPIRVYSQ